jgi:hypothetical protein
MGCLLAGKSAEQWEQAFRKLQRAGTLAANGRNLFTPLRISYDGLDDEQQEMFLDVACSMLGWPATAAKAIWEG